MPIPEKKEIDELAQLYLDAREAQANVDANVAMYRDQLLDLVAEHGFLPPRATKSKRLLGEIYKITSAGGSSLELDGTQVTRCRETFPRRVFNKLFRREVVHVLKPGAEQIAPALLGKGKAAAAFRACLMLKERGASIEVEHIEKQKKEK